MSGLVLVLSHISEPANFCAIRMSSGSRSSGSPSDGSSGEGVTSPGVTTGLHCAICQVSNKSLINDSWLSVKPERETDVIEL